VSRTRFETVAGPFGFYRSRSGGINIQRIQEAEYQRCVDETLLGDGHPLDIYKVTASGGLVNSVDLGDGFVYAQDYPCDYMSDHTKSGLIIPTVPGMPSLAERATKLLANTNPSRPYVDLPIAIVELRDLPSLLKQEGSFIKELAASNLKYRFGAGPLISDLANLMGFGDAVRTRTRELTKLFQSGIRRKRMLASGILHEGPIPVTLSGTSTVEPKGMAEKITMYKSWGFVEWFPNHKGVPSPDKMHALARKAVFGLTVDFSTAWELIPWSWLVDYFGNIGDFFEATRNIVGQHHGPVEIMTEWKMHAKLSATEAKTPIGQAPGRSYRCSEGQVKATWKQRRKVTGASLSASLPFLSAGQVSILGSIGVTRRSRATRGFRNG